MTGRRIDAKEEGSEKKKKNRRLIERAAKLSEGMVDQQQSLHKKKNTRMVSKIRLKLLYVR